MRKFVIAALAAALIVPATASTATANTTDTLRPATAAASTPTRVQALRIQRTAAFALANRMATQAPRINWRQKSRNADLLSRRMALPNISRQERAIAIGRTQLGTRYRFGGTTPAGFDCSGFTRYAFGKAGKNLPRTAAQQKRATRAVSSPRVGDLVFLGGKNPYHVGIYLGNNRMLHSPRSGKSVEVARIWSRATYGRVL